MAAYNYTILYHKGASNGKPNALSRRPDYVPPPFPSHPILSPPHDPLLHTPYLRSAAVLLLPNDPLLLDIATAQAGDAAISATIIELQGGPAGESNPTPCLVASHWAGREISSSFRVASSTIKAAF